MNVELAKELKVDVQFSDELKVALSLVFQKALLGQGSVGEQLDSLKMYVQDGEVMLHPASKSISIDYSSIEGGELDGDLSV